MSSCPNDDAPVLVQYEVPAAHQEEEDVGDVERDVVDEEGEELVDELVQSHGAAEAPRLGARPAVAPRHQDDPEVVQHRDDEQERRDAVGGEGVPRVVRVAGGQAEEEPGQELVPDVAGALRLGGDDAHGVGGSWTLEKLPPALVLCDPRSLGPSEVRKTSSGRLIPPLSPACPRKVPIIKCSREWRRSVTFSVENPRRGHFTFFD